MTGYHAPLRSLTLRAFTRQRGSTLTGLIIGLIVGLGIAVAVALTITKGASPFTEKTAKSGRPADPAPGEALDPNKPMYANRDAARVASKEVAQKAASRSSRPAPEEAPASIPAQPPVAKPAPAAAPSDDPLGQAIAGLKEQGESRSDAARESRQAAPVPKAVTPPSSSGASLAASSNDKYIYYLQFGAFRNMSDAEATRAKLALLGFETTISDHNNDSGVLHRVRLGPFNQVEAMNKARAKLLDSGVDVAIVRNQR